MPRRLAAIALLPVALGCRHASTSGHDSSPVTIAVPTTAPADYDSAVASVELRQSMDDSVAVSAGRSILMTHGARTPRVFLLLHGFTDSPAQFADLGERFYAGGDNVLIPRLPHHAERRSPVRALGRVTAHELKAFGDSVVDEARGLGDSVVVVGLSAGGSIAARIAQSRPEVARVVLIAPAIAAGGVSAETGSDLVDMAAVLPDVTRTSATDSTRPDFVQGMTTRGLGQVLRLGRSVSEDAGSRAPGVRRIAFLVNERDHTVSEEASLTLAQLWSDHGASVTVHRFPDKLHLPHNVMEPASRKGKPELVYPVITALALGGAPPGTVKLLGVPCHGWRCDLRRAMHVP